MQVYYILAVFFCNCIDSGDLGMRGAFISMEIAKWLIIVFIILAILSLVFGGNILMGAPLVGW